MPDDASLGPKETDHLREVMEIRLNSLKSEVESLDALLTEKLLARDRAVELISKSTETHLKELNNEAARLLSAISAMKSEYVDMKSFLVWRENLDREISHIREHISTDSGKSAAIPYVAMVVSVLVALAMVFIRVFKT